MSEAAHLPMDQFENIEASRRSLAAEHDKRAREIERQRTEQWSELADICMCVRDAEEWRILGFSSFNRWLLDAVPKSRSSVYAAMGVVEELQDVTKEDLSQIEQGNATILSKLPKKMRQSRKVIAAAKSLPPRKFIEKIQEQAPDLHIEQKVARKLKFTPTQEKTIDAAIGMVRLLTEDEMSDEDALESICADYLEGHRKQYEDYTRDINWRR